MRPMHFDRDFLDRTIEPSPQLVDVLLLETARSQGFVEKEIVDEYCGGYCAGFKFGEATCDAGAASKAAASCFKSGCDTAVTGDRIESMLSELVSKGSILV